MLPTVALLSLAAVANAHIAAWKEGMFCKGGNNPAVDDQNTNLVVNPLYNLPKRKWWMQADRGCHKVPPPNGEVMEVPAGGSLDVELATNRAFTTLSYGGKYTSDWDDGKNRTEPWVAPGPGKCLGDNTDGLGGELHTSDHAHAAGTAFAISYAENLEDVTMENLVVFTTKSHTPWYRKSSYDVPTDLPATCPHGRCYCAWLWVPEGCGQPNMYMQSFYCNVTGSTSTKKLAAAKPPHWCDGDSTKCVPGAKQMIAWNQADGNNVVVPNGKSPAYNQLMGWAEGAQDDIFEDSAPISISTTAPTTGTANPATLSTQTKPTTTTTSAGISIHTSSNVTNSVTTTKAPASSTTTSTCAVSTVTTNTIKPPASSSATTSSTSKTMTTKPVQTTLTSSRTSRPRPTDSCGNHDSY